MKTSRLFAAATVAATAAVLASCAAGIRKDDLVGIWVQPVPGMAMVQGIELKEIDASASEFGKTMTAPSRCSESSAYQIINNRTNATQRENP